MAYAAAVPAADEPAEDNAAKVELPSLSTRIEWLDEWEERTRDYQKLARVDRDYYDGKQWSADELKILRDRGQPPLVKNRIARKINFIRGEEIRKRINPAARPRTPQHEDGARAATDSLRYAADEERFDQVRSAVMANVLVEGYGGAEKGMEPCPTADGGTEYKHRLTHVQWDRLFYDPHSRQVDFSDAKYKGIVVWRDIEDAIEDYPEAKEALQGALSRDIGEAGGTTDDVPRRWVDRKRKRIKIAQMYFRVGKNWYRSDFTQADDLGKIEQTFLLDDHGYSVCPLEMASCYIDQEGMRYGVVRQLISPQDEINKRASKALHLLSVRQVIAEKDSVPDPRKFQSELAKPDGYAEVAHDGLQMNRVQITQTGDLAAGHVQMMEAAKADIDAIGPSSATLPDMPESASGRAFIARQQAASQELGPVFDSLRNWSTRVFELDWMAVRQYWTEEKWLRVTDDQELTGYRFVALNRQMSRAARLQELLQKQVPFPKALETAAGNVAPLVMMQAQMQMQQMMAQQQAQMQAMQQQAQMTQPPAPGGPPNATPPPVSPEQQQQAVQSMVLQHPMMQEMITENQVEQMQVDIVLDVAPDTAILAQEEFSTLSDLMGPVLQARPDMAPSMVKLMVRASQLPSKRELLQEMDKGPDPQAQQMQQMAQQLQMAGAKAGVAVQESQAQLNAAKAQSEQAKSQIAGAKAPSEIEKNQASAMRDAAHAGSQAGSAPPPAEGLGPADIPPTEEAPPWQG